MARTAQRLAIIGAITVTIIGYLYHAPHTEDFAQRNRIRAQGATIKIADFVVCKIFLVLFYNIFHYCRVPWPNYLDYLLVF
jgi:hypothetical protein